MRVLKGGGGADTIKDADISNHKTRGDDGSPWITAHEVGPEDAGAECSECCKNCLLIARVSEVEVGTDVRQAGCVHVEYEEFNI